MHKMIQFPIWHLANTSYNSILYKSDDYHYIVTKDGEWTPILSCGLYIIVNQQLLSLFQQHLDVPVFSHAVSIYDRVLDKYFEGYYRIYIENEILPETIDKVDHSGIKIWCHKSSGGIFITTELKSILEQSDITALETHAGFCRYG
jgi:hypothetical protein